MNEIDILLKTKSWNEGQHRMGQISSINIALDRNLVVRGKYWGEMFFSFFGLNWHFLLAYFWNLKPHFKYNRIKVLVWENVFYFHYNKTRQYWRKSFISGWNRIIFFFQIFFWYFYTRKCLFLPVNQMNKTNANLMLAWPDFDFATKVRGWLALGAPIG